MKSYVIATARTPRGRGKAGKGALSGIHPQELLGQVLNALPSRGGFEPGQVDDVITGAVSQVNEQGANIARNAVLAAGWPQEVTGVSINRFCGSGLQAINFAAMGTASGAQDLVVASGVESMSKLSLGADGAGQDGGNLKLRERVYQVPQGISADLIATLEGISRADVDAFALRSQRLAAQAIEEKRFSLVPVTDPFTGKVVLDREEFPRPDSTAAGLAALPAAFVKMGEQFDPIALAAYPQARKIDHVHTAGNSSGIVDGAAAVAIASEKFITDHGIKPRARIRSVATFGMEPLIMLTAPAPASQKALKLAGMTAADIDLWEINEAFAAVVIQTTRALGIDLDRVNVNGGAIALGHPLGASGAILVGTVLDELERSNKTTALVTMCIGGGQGIATILERI
ncbi:MAG: acetyl-CoA C-acetyltransferase [Kofleriaceae bacterium]